MQISKLFFPFILHFITVPLLVFAQDNDETAVLMEELPTEIIIDERRSPYQVQREMFQAEESFYTMFNQLVDEKRFKIYCTTRDRNFSHTEVRECKPNFEMDATSVDSQEFLAVFRTVYGGGSGELPSGTSPQIAGPESSHTIPYQQEELKTKMEELVATNPELREALVKYAELKAKYLRLKGQDNK